VPVPDFLFSSFPFSLSAKKGRRRKKGKEKKGTKSGKGNGHGHEKGQEGEKGFTDFSLDN